MTVSLAKTEPNTLLELIQKNAAEFARVLPAHVGKEKFMRIAISAVKTTPKLLECTPASLMLGIYNSAKLGLLLDGFLGQAYLIPRRNGKNNNKLEANFQVGYKGLLQLARRSGEIASVQARLVHEKDKFKVKLGDNPTLIHEPATGDRGPVKYVYAVVFYRTKDLKPDFEVWTVEQVEEHRKRYSRDTREDAAWATNWDSMAKKTLIIQALKYSPMSTDLEKAVGLIEADQVGISQVDKEIIDVPLELEADKALAAELAKEEAQENREPGEEG